MRLPIITDKKLLTLASEDVTDFDKANEIITNLIDTANYFSNKAEGCAGLAANQIGYLENIIIVKYGGAWLTMINPVIQNENGKMQLSGEGCLSRPGVKRKIKRYKRIKVSFCDRNGIIFTKKFVNFDARVVQHEVDHLNGKFI
jgi:peptide deformylase